MIFLSKKEKIWIYRRNSPHVGRRWGSPHSAIYRTDPRNSPRDCKLRPCLYHRKYHRYRITYSGKTKKRKTKWGTFLTIFGSWMDYYHIFLWRNSRKNAEFFRLFIIFDYLSISFLTMHGFSSRQIRKEDYTSAKYTLYFLSYLYYNHKFLWMTKK